MDMVYSTPLVQEIPGIMEGTGRETRICKMCGYFTGPLREDDVTCYFNHWFPYRNCTFLCRKISLQVTINSQEMLGGYGWVTVSGVLGCFQENNAGGAQDQCYFL
jgi:hypothetical protein